MRRIETDRKRGTRDQAADRRRLYEVPERPLIEPQGHKGVVVMRDKDESIMEGGRILQRRPFKGHRETFDDPVMPELTSDGLGEWSEKYDMRGDAVWIFGGGLMVGRLLSTCLDWGVFQIWGRPGLRTDVEMAARVKVVTQPSSSSGVLLGLRLGGDVVADGAGYLNTQEGVWLVIKPPNAYIVVQNGDGTYNEWVSFDSSVSLGEWMWATFALSGGLVYASIGSATAEKRLGKPLGSQNAHFVGGQIGVGVQGDAEL